jgi:hypothetical protein
VPVANQREDQQQKRDHEQPGRFRGVHRVAMIGLAMIGLAMIGVGMLRRLILPIVRMWGGHANIVSPCRKDLYSLEFPGTNLTHRT